MNRLVVAAFLLLPLTMTASPTCASTTNQSQWVKYSHAASAMLAQKNYQRACELYDAAAQCAENEHRQPEELANTLLNLADCQIEAGAIRDAWTSILRVRAIIKSQHLGDDPIAIRLMRRETSYYQRQRMYLQAVDCQKNVVGKVRTIFGDSTALISEYVILQYLQESFAHESRAAAQTGLVTLALMRKMKFDPLCDKWLWVFNRTGVSLKEIGKESEAIPLWKESLQMGIGCRSVEHGGFALEQLVNVAAHEQDAKDRASLVAELIPLADKMCAIETSNGWLKKMRQQLKEMQAASAAVAPAAQ